MTLCLHPFLQTVEMDARIESWGSKSTSERARLESRKRIAVILLDNVFFVVRTRPAVGSILVQATCRASRALSSSDQAAETDAQLLSLHEVSAAADLAGLGRRSEAASLLERAVEICSGSMGHDSALARAAVHRWGCCAPCALYCIASLPDPLPPRYSSVAALTASSEGQHVLASYGRGKRWSFAV